MEDIQTRILALCPMRFALDLDLSDERGDGLDGIRDREKSHQRQARVRQARMNTLTNGPDFGLAGQGCERLDRIIGHHVIKLPHESLVGSENDRANRTRIDLPFPLHLHRGWLALPKARAQPQLHGPIAVSYTHL